MKRFSTLMLWTFAFAAVLAGALPADAAQPVVIVRGAMYCAGVAVTPQHVVTNRHCVDGAAKVTVEPDGGTISPASVVKMSDTDDLALLIVPGAQFEPVRLGSMASLSVGSPVKAVGHPRKRNWTTTAGTVLGLAQAEKELFLRHSAATDVGSSGGALLDEHGRLVGIQMAHHSVVGSLAVPVDIVRAFVASVL